MIVRHWRGWTRVEDADTYEELLKSKVLPGLKKIEGYRGGYIFRSDETEEAEFVVVNFFESVAAGGRVLGAEYFGSGVLAGAERLLLRVGAGGENHERGGEKKREGGGEREKS